MAAANKFGGWSETVTSPATDAMPVTPSDTTDLAVMTKALRVAATGTGGTVRVITEAGTTRDLPIAAGEQWDVRVSRVLATGTTATGIWALV